jgi:hypothetical protein
LNSKRKKEKKQIEGDKRLSGSKLALNEQQQKKKRNKLILIIDWG